MESNTEARHLAVKVMSNIIYSHHMMLMDRLRIPDQTAGRVLRKKSHSPSHVYPLLHNITLKHVYPITSNEQTKFLYKYELDMIKSREPIHFFLDVVESNNVKIIEYILNIFRDNIEHIAEDMLGLLVNDGWFEVSQYLVHNVRHRYTDNMIERCCYEGQSRCVLWLLDNGVVDIGNGVEYAYIRGHFGVVFNLYMHGYIPNFYLCKCKCKYVSSKEVIDILHNYYISMIDFFGALYIRSDNMLMDNNILELLNTYITYHSIIHPSMLM